MTKDFNKIDRIIDKLILPEIRGEKEQLLILAGDIGSVKCLPILSKFIDNISKRFKEVLYIPGNHEPYRGDINTYLKKIALSLKDFDNVHFNDKFIYVSGVQTFRLATLWSDFDNKNEISMILARDSMNDYHIINDGDSVMRPSKTLEIHKKHLKFLANCEEGDVIITHHLPSFKSIDPSFKESLLNGSYASNLEGLILDKKPSLWIHGHTHAAQDYKIGDTRIICNPRGYGTQHLSNGYNNKLVIEV